MEPQAINETPRSNVLSRLAALQAQNQVTHTQIANDRARRYIWQCIEDIPWHSNEIAGGWIERARVTPVFAAPIWERIDDVPEELRLDTRGEFGKITEAKYEVQPGGIYLGIMEMYEGWGVMELSALYDIQLSDFLRLNVDGIFCPWLKDRELAVDEVPKPYSEIKAHIMRVAENLTSDSRRDTLTKVAEDMLKSLERSASHDVAMVDALEAQKEFAYTKPVLRALDRLERRRRDHALNDMAKTQNAVFSEIPRILAGQDQSSMAALLAAQQEHNALLSKQLNNQSAAIEALLAERAPAADNKAPQKKA